MAILSEDNRWKHRGREVCVCSAASDQPHERSEKKGSSEENGGLSSTLDVTTCAFYSFSSSVFSLSYSLLLSRSFLSARPFCPHHPPTPSLPLLPCSTCLSELGWARCTPSSGGGPCLLSINNLWNLEIQVGPVSGRLYHTLEGGLPATLDGLSYLFLAFSVCFLQV